MAIFEVAARAITSGFARIVVGNSECRIEGDTPTDKLMSALSYQNAVVAEFLRSGCWGELIQKELDKAKENIIAANGNALKELKAQDEYRVARKEANTVYLYDPINKSFPTTLLKRVLRTFRASGIKYEVVNCCSKPEPVIDIAFDSKEHEARSYQQRAVDIAMHCRCGAFALATNAGKTGVMLRIIAKKRIKTLILVQKQELMYQIHDAIQHHLNYNAGLAGAGQFVLKPITVAIINSAHMRVNDLIRYGFDQVFVDEGHHAASRIHYTVLDKIKPYSIYSMTGTDFRTHKAENVILEAAFGGTVQRVDNKYMVENGFSASLKAEIIDCEQELHPSLPWKKIYKQAVISSTKRTVMLVSAVKRHADAGETVLVLTDETSHGQIIHNMLVAAGLNARFMHGAIGREERMAARMGFKRREFQVLTGTSIYDEGVDFPTLDVVAFAGGKKAKGKVFQRLGRGQRRGLHADGTQKVTATVIDFYDYGHRLLKKHSLRRLLHMYEVGVVMDEKYTQLLIKEGLINGDEDASVRGCPESKQRRRQGQTGSVRENGGGDVPRKRHTRVRGRRRERGRGEEGES